MEKKQELEIIKIYENARKLDANVVIGLGTSLSEDNKESLEILKINTPDITKDAADTVINARNVKIFVHESDETEENAFKKMFDKNSRTLRKYNGNILENLSSDIRINSGIELSDNIHEAIEELRNMSNEEVDALIRNTNPPLLTNFNPLANLNNEELEKCFELTESDFDDAKYVSQVKQFLQKQDSVNLKNENINLKFTKENDELLTKTKDNYFMNKRIGPMLSESSKNEIERIYREARKYGTMPFKISNGDEYMSYPIAKPFFEEKYIPTEKKFKDEAKKLKVTGNFSSLGAAQNELAKRYGFKEYRAIKSSFPELSKSYDNIKSILINTNKLNEIENNKLNTFILKFSTIFRKMSISIGVLNLGNMFNHIEPRLYEKKLESLEIHENSLMQIYSYFLTENSIIFGQIKRNIQKLSQDEKINILKDFESLEIDKKDETVFGLFVGLLEYHIGKSSGDVILHKNEDGSIDKEFVPKSSSGPIKNSLNDEVFDFLKYNIDSTKLLNEIAANQVVTKVKEDFAYKTTKGFFIYFINNIVMENRLTADIIKKISNELPIGSKVECNQFLYDRRKGNVLNVLAMDFQPTNILVEKLYKIASAINSTFSKHSSIESTLTNILGNKELKIDSDGNIKVNISNNEILDSMGISQSKEEGLNRAKETLKKFGLKPNTDGNYE